LIIALIFFILYTLILGVTTWLGFSGQDELAKKAAEAEKKAKDWETDADWYKFQTVYFRNIAGDRFAKDGEVAGPLKSRWQQLKGVTRDTLKEDAGKLVEQYDKNFGWDPQPNSRKPCKKAQPAAKQKENENLKQCPPAAKAELTQARTEAATATDELKKARAVYADELKKLQNLFTTDLTKHTNT